GGRGGGVGGGGGAGTAAGPPGSAHRGAGPGSPFGVVVIVVLAALPMLAPWGARRFAAVHRGLVARLLGERIAGPPPLRHGRGPGPWPVATACAGPGWRAGADLLVELPVTGAELYAAVPAGARPAHLTSPL